MESSLRLGTLILMGRVWDGKKSWPERVELFGREPG
jgi:hypothetical protein